MANGGEGHGKEVAPMHTTLAASAFDPTFWTGVAGIGATLFGTITAGVLSYKGTKNTAERTSETQIALKREEARSNTQAGKRREKLDAIHAFLEAVDFYWHMMNDLWNRVKKGEQIRSFREETAQATAQVTKAQLRLELVSSGELRDAAENYVRALVDAAKSVTEDRKWNPPDRELHQRLLACAREELKYEEA
ncbi:hypothetical protein [Streptomyces massasporeus]|uniref:hypothetical protein n=1 Tax=Streptomyces massasporeus TaxID=67324 RepID=UPI00380819FA